MKSTVLTIDLTIYCVPVVTLILLYTV